MTNGLIQHPGTALIDGKWDGASDRGLRARQERQRIIEAVLSPGIDYGVIPGTDKSCLMKSGAEKVSDALDLYAAYEPLVQTEDWDKPLFFYRYLCTLRQRGSDMTVATGIGSCNSMEAKYRWRQADRVCPKCGAPAIIKGKEEYGGGWLCFAKKGGCGAKWKVGAIDIENQSVGKVENDDIYTQVNTIDKMAQKRALVAAALNLGFSDQFTQDMEDIGSELEPKNPEETQHREPSRTSKERTKEMRAALTGMDKVLLETEASKTDDGPNHIPNPNVPRGDIGPDGIDPIAESFANSDSPTEIAMLWGKLSAKEMRKYEAVKDNAKARLGMR